MTSISYFKTRFYPLKGRLAEELRTEQEHGLAADKTLKTLSAQSMELRSRLEDVETTALRHGRKIVAKLEERVRALESELCKSLFTFPVDFWRATVGKISVFFVCLR